ncbi:MAG: hypothetical protein M1823_004157 [Watsoniomyces obsoletus]|nr:MAG: hypothetical protein M1823_004157 [Watsoniomyces obsoletus]
MTMSTEAPVPASAASPSSTSRHEQTTSGRRSLARRAKQDRATPGHYQQLVNGRLRKRYEVSPSQRVMGSRQMTRPQHRASLSKKRQKAAAWKRAGAGRQMSIQEFMVIRQRHVTDHPPRSANPPSATLTDHRPHLSEDHEMGLDEPDVTARIIGDSQGDVHLDDPDPSLPIVRPIDDVESSPLSSRWNSEPPDDVRRYLSDHDLEDGHEDERGDRHDDERDDENEDDDDDMLFLNGSDVLDHRPQPPRGLHQLQMTLSTGIKDVWGDAEYPSVEHGEEVERDEDDGEERRIESDRYIRNRSAPPYSGLTHDGGRIDRQESPRSSRPWTAQRIPSSRPRAASPALSEPLSDVPSSIFAGEAFYLKGWSPDRPATTNPDTAPSKSPRARRKGKSVPIQRARRASRLWRPGAAIDASTAPNADEKPFTMSIFGHLVPMEVVAVR